MLSDTLKICKAELQGLRLPPDGSVRYIVTESLLDAMISLAYKDGEIAGDTAASARFDKLLADRIGKGGWTVSNTHNFTTDDGYNATVGPVTSSSRTIDDMSDAELADAMQSVIDGQKDQFQGMVVLMVSSYVKSAIKRLRESGQDIYRSPGWLITPDANYFPRVLHTPETLKSSQDATAAMYAAGKTHDCAALYIGKGAGR